MSSALVALGLAVAGCGAAIGTGPAPLVFVIVVFGLAAALVATAHLSPHRHSHGLFPCLARVSGAGLAPLAPANSGPNLVLLSRPRR